MRIRRISLAIAAAAGAVSLPLLASSAHASDVLLKDCPSSNDRQPSLPASRDLGSSWNWYPDGFRSCQWQGRYVVRVTCWPGDLVKPELNIVNDSTGQRKAYPIPEDGSPHYFWNSSYPDPNGSEKNLYHMHLHQSGSTFTDCIVRVGA